MKQLIVACAALALGGGQAVAGPCASQIAALEQHLSSRDAGAGPILGAGSGTAGQEQISEAGSGTRDTTEASRAPREVRTNGNSNGSNTTGPTAAMGQAAASGAASPQDVRLQQQGKPTQAEAARSQTPVAAHGEDKLQKVAADLDRARKLDGSNDAACARAVADANKDMDSD